MSNEEPPQSPSIDQTPWLAAFLALYAGVFHTFIALLLAVQIGPGSLQGTAGIGAILGYGAAFALVARRLTDPPQVALGLVPARVGSVIVAALLIPSLLLTSEIENLFREIFPWPEPTGDPPEPHASTAYQAAIVLIVVMPMVYELFFRGFLQPRLVRRLGSVRGVLLTAALNTLAGMFLSAPSQIPAAFGRFLLLGVLRQCSGSVRPSIALHAMWGAITVGAYLGLYGIAGFDDTSQPHTSAVWLLPAFVLTLLGLWQARRVAQRP
jgi:membrane protease YdiL (CAAX protease family)